VTLQGWGACPPSPGLWLVQSLDDLGAEGLMTDNIVDNTERSAARMQS
jgi:hypothetical protein